MGKKTLDTTYRLLSPTDAETLAALMRASDPDWSYQAVHDPLGTGYSYIEIRDEDDNFVARY